MKEESKYYTTRNLPYPKLDMKALEDFIGRLQNSEKFKEHVRKCEEFSKIGISRLEQLMEDTRHKIHEE